MITLLIFSRIFNLQLFAILFSSIYNERINFDPLVLNKNLYKRKANFNRFGM